MVEDVRELFSKVDKASVAAYYGYKLEKEEEVKK